MLSKLAELREERAENENGFTLIELLVVVVIIGVLVAIAIPLYLNYRAGAQNRSAQADVRNAVSGIENCIGDNAGKAPTSGATSVSSTGGSIYLTCAPTGTSGAASTGTIPTAPTGGSVQTLNVSTGVTLTYTFVSTSNYTVAGSYNGSGKTYTYNNLTGKTT